MGKHNPRLVGRIKGLITISVIAAASSAAPAWAACDTWTLNASGNWFGAGGWSAGDPNSGSTDACIVDGASAVTMNGSASVANFSLASGNILNVGGNRLTVAGASLSNAGLININNGFLTVANTNTVLSGGGTLSLSSDVFINQASGGLTLTNQDNTIQGTGQIGQNGLALVNGGIVNANVSTQTLSLNGAGAVTNTGLLTATSGGSLAISNNVANTGGNITANGGTVTISSAITGGTLNSKNSGTLTSGNASLTGVTISSGTTYNVGGTTDLFGTITNNGIITMPNTTLSVSGGDVILQGGGTVSMTGDAFFNQSSGGLTLHNVDNLIQGSGQLGQNGLALDNQAGGTVNANISGVNLSLNGAGVITNAGLLTATSGGILNINNTVNNSSNITANGGTVNITSTINGGALNALNGGVLNTGGAVLNGLTVSSGTTVNDLNTTYLQGTITNNGNFVVPNTNLTVNGGDVTLQGGGTVSMTGDAFFNQSSGGLTLHNVDNLIQGSGQLGQNGLALDNQSAGTVNANISGAALTLSGGGVITNAGLITATGGGILNINNTVNNSSNITANGGTVNITSTINGGTLNSLNGGVLSTSGAVLNGLTVSSGTTVNDLNTTFLQGTINNKGNFVLPNTNLTVFGGDVTLQGGGTVSMTQDAFFNQASGGLNLHNVDNLIQGSGQLGQNGLALDNQSGGTVNANISGATLTLGGGNGTVTNAGLLTATNGGILITTSTVNNSSNITANGGTVDVNSRINGGTLNAVNGGTLNTNAGSILNGVTISSGTTANVTNVTLLQGTITNHGNFALPNNNLTILGDVTLQGGGTVSMTQDAFFNQDSGGLTLHNVDNTIQGTGQLGQNGMTIDNRAGGKIVANVSNGTLNVNGGGILTNAGTLKATNGGTLAVSTPLSASNFAANTLQGGGSYVVNGTTGVSTLQINSFGVTGGEVNTIGANTTVTLIGSNANVQFLDGRSLNALNLSANQGNLNLEGGYSLAGGSFTNSGDVLIDPNSALIVSPGQSYVQTGGETQVDGTISADLVDIQGGVLRGGNGTTSGAISGTVNNDCGGGTCGTVRAGDNLNVPIDPPGNLSIGGDYIHNSGATLIVDIAGPLAPQTSQLNVAGNVQLLGANDFLTISLLNNYVPQTTGKFLFMTYAGTLNAQDFSLTDPNVDPNGIFKVDYATAGDIFLDFTATGSSVTPEPSFLLPVIGLLGLVVVYRKRRQSRAKA